MGSDGSVLQFCKADCRKVHPQYVWHAGIENVDASVRDNGSVNTHFQFSIIVSLSWSTNPSQHNVAYFGRRRYQLRQMGSCIEMGFNEIGATRWAQRFRTTFFESRYGISERGADIKRLSTAKLQQSRTVVSVWPQTGFNETGAMGWAQRFRTTFCKPSWEISERGADLKKSEHSQIAAFTNGWLGLAAAGAYLLICCYTENVWAGNYLSSQIPHSNK